MRRILLALSLALFAGCAGDNSMPNTSPDVVQGTGTIRYQSLEGGFYGIVGDDGRHLDPTNLPASLTTDGVRVHYLARTRKDLASIHMWGIIVDLISIDRAP